MIIVEKITEIAEILLKSAQERTTYSMTDFHNLFDENTPPNNKYDTLEAASRALEHDNIAIYSVMLSKRENNIPGDGFYDVFRNKRYDEFIELVGNKSLQELEANDKIRIAAYERPIVYENAENRF